ncbi:hypothetical protein PHMEG_00029095 [Phytophthora megakarya]|uniref:Uncharacterized protein n=1 Tax=Phytophthora megakarya TaxID=4795 RepID=A0A225V3I0_9STRA|nr:hypothetical protein PHMEG_00029095 [Phytophthora megakarya]
MARQPPARVNSFLDQRLDSASTIQEVLTAAVTPHRLPPQEADELVRLKDEVSRLQTRCEDAERGLANEVQLRTATEADSVRSTEDFYTIHDANQDLRNRERGIAMRYVAQERERMKAGLAVYNAELTKLRQYLEEHDRGKVSSPSPRMKALLAENASLPGLSASGLDWELLGLGPDHTGLLRLLPRSSQSEGSVDGNSTPPVVEASESPSKVSPGSGRSTRSRPNTHLFGLQVIRLWGRLPRSRKTARSAFGRSEEKAAPTATPSVVRFDHKKARSSTSGLSIDKEPLSPPHPPLRKARLMMTQDLTLVLKPPLGRSAASDSVVDLTIDDATDLSSKKDSSPFSSPVVSYFPRQDGRPRRSISVVSELRMRLEYELADDDFMLRLTSEDSVAATSTPPQGQAPAVTTPAGAAELSTKKSVVTEPPTADSSVEAQVPPESSSAVDSSVEAQVPLESSSAETPIPSSPPPPPQQPSAVQFHSF